MRFNRVFITTDEWSKVVLDNRDHASIVTVASFCTPRHPWHGDVSLTAEYIVTDVLSIAAFTVVGDADDRTVEFLRHIDNRLQACTDIAGFITITRYDRYDRINDDETNITNLYGFGF